MIDNIITSAILWVEQQILSAFKVVQSIFTDVFSCDLTNFNRMFNLDTISSVIEVLAFVLMFLVVAFQLLRTVAGPMSEGQDEPWKLIVRTGIATFLIFNFIAIGNFILDESQVLYYGLYSSYVYMDDDRAKMNEVNNEVADNLAALTGVDPDDDDASDRDSSPLVDDDVADFGSGIILTILGLVFFVLVAFSYVQFLISMAERYAIVGVLLYTSPLVVATMPSKATSNIFSSWCRMFGSQILLLLMNGLFLAMINQAFLNMTSGMGSNSASNAVFMLTLAAFMRIARKFDTYLGMIGLTSAPANMGMEAMMAVRQVAHDAGSLVSGANRLGHGIANMGERAQSPGGPGMGVGTETTITQSSSSEEHGNQGQNVQTNKEGSTDKKSSGSQQDKSSVQSGKSNAAAGGASTPEKGKEGSGTGKESGKGSNVDPSEGSQQQADQKNEEAEKAEQDNLEVQDAAQPDAGGNDQNDDESAGAGGGPGGEEVENDNVEPGDEKSGGIPGGAEENGSGGADDEQSGDENGSEGGENSETTNLDTTSKGEESTTLSMGGTDGAAVEKTAGTKDTHSEGSSERKTSSDTTSQESTDTTGEAYSNVAGRTTGTKTTQSRLIDKNGNEIKTPNRAVAMARGFKYGWTHKQTEGQAYKQSMAFQNTGPNIVNTEDEYDSSKNMGIHNMGQTNGSQHDESVENMSRESNNRESYRFEKRRYDDFDDGSH